MGSVYTTLPFERGKTFSTGNTNVIGATKNLKLLGKTYVVPDTVHGTGNDVTLRVMMYTGSDTTSDNVCYALSTTTEGDWGCKVSAVTGSQGVVGLPLDDAMTSGTAIPQYDLCYFVVKGPCDIKTDGVAALTAGSSVTTDASGYIDTTAAAASDFVLGVLAETAAQVAGTAETVFVTCGDNLGLATS